MSPTIAARIFHRQEQKQGGKQKTQKKKKDKQTEQELRDGYRRARALIMDGQYEAGIAAMHALGHDDNAEIANYIGYANRKLGRYDDSKLWYEKALAADPNTSAPGPTTACGMPSRATC